jgi:hypothetical protein
VPGGAGIQTQAYATSVLTTLRKGLTKLETAGYAAGSLVLHPLDWKDVELARASSKRRRAGLGWAIGVRIWPAYHRVRPLRMRKGRVYDLTRPSELTA